MTALLCKLFIRDRDNIKSPAVRRAYGTLSSIVGIVLNLLLFAGKFTVGTLFGSISVRADGINNLSDAGSQIISLVSFKISARPADRDHPYGHARIEYIASMIVSFLILFIGVDLVKSSLAKIFGEGEATEFSIISIVVLSVSILVKLWLFFFNRRIGKKIESSVIAASGADSLSDALATSAVLVSTVIYYFTKFDTDAYISILVAVFIIVAGLKILNETKNSILGEAPSKELVDNIKSIVFSHPEALGIHDMAIHSYGPGVCLASLHVEVDGNKDIFESHDAIDNIEKQLYSELNVIATIHLDPVAVGDAFTDALHEKAIAIVKGIDERLDIHDFRCVKGSTHTNVIFDIELPFEVGITPAGLKAAVKQRESELGENVFVVINVDRV